MPPVFDHLAQLHVQALDRVRCVDHLPNLRRVAEERDHFLPVALPTLPDHRIFLPQATLVKLLEPLPSHRRAFCPVDILQPLRHRLALFPTAKAQTVARQMHDAGLHLLWFVLLTMIHCPTKCRQFPFISFYIKKFNDSRLRAPA